MKCEFIYRNSTVGYVSIKDRKTNLKSYIRHNLHFL